MAERGLLAPVRRAVAPDQVGRTVAEKVLDIDLAGVVRDRPGREGMAEAMRVHLADPAAPAEAATDLFEPVGAQPGGRVQTPVARGDE